jgi:TPP-dependent pyruvate/acetoin dehydrogenase alpha subunit
MNVIDVDHGLLGSFGIVGGSLTAATGAALALRGSGAVAVAFFGDGTANQGYFLECLNFAKVHRLPLLAVCENNLYGEFTPWEQITAGSISARPRAMEIPTARINGNNLWDVRDCAGQFLEEIRAGAGPRFIEAITYRFGGHSRSDPGAYRPEGELDAWRLHDPLALERAHLVDELGVDVAAIDALHREVVDEVETMVERARKAPWPTPDPDLTEFAP